MRRRRRTSAHPGAGPRSRSLSPPAHSEPSPPSWPRQSSSKPSPDGVQRPNHRSSGLRNSPPALSAIDTWPRAAYPWPQQQSRPMRAASAEDYGRTSPVVEDANQQHAGDNGGRAARRKARGSLRSADSIRRPSANGAANELGAVLLPLRSGLYSPLRSGLSNPDTLQQSGFAGAPSLGTRLAPAARTSVPSQGVLIPGFACQ